MSEFNFDEEWLKGLDEPDLADELGRLLWEIGRHDGSNDVVGDARMTQFISLAIFERPDGGKVCRVTASNRDGAEIPPWELKGLVKHLADTLDPPLPMFVYEPSGDEEE